MILPWLNYEFNALKIKKPFSRGAETAVELQYFFTVDLRWFLRDCPHCR